MKHTDHIGPLTLQLTDDGVNVILVVAGPKILVKPDSHRGFVRIKGGDMGIQRLNISVVGMVQPLIGGLYRRLNRQIVIPPYLYFHFRPLHLDSRHQAYDDDDRDKGSVKD